jgi:protein required for attachment to host cells
VARLLVKAMIKRSNTWIVVADGARGRFFKASDDMKKLISVGKAHMVSPNSRQRPSELKSDKPGRSYSSSRSGARHALEPPHDYQKLEKHRFMAELAETLESARTRGEFNELVLVLPRRSLGELRSLLSKEMQKCVRQEIAKDFTNETAAALLRRLTPRLRSVSLTVRPARS